MSPFRPSANDLAHDDPRRVPELLAVAVLAVSFIIVLGADAGVPAGPLRIPAGIVATMVGPGWAFLLALRIRPASTVDRIALAVVASFAIAAIVGVVLATAPVGIDARRMTVGITLVAALALAAAILRGLVLEDGSVVEGPPEPFRFGRRHVGPAVLLLLAVLVPIAIIVRYLPAADRGVPVRTTALAIGEGERVVRVLEDPRRAVVELPVEIRNSGGVAQVYDLAVQDDRGRALDEAKGVEVAADGVWSRTFTVEVGCQRRVVAALWRAGEAGVPLRSVHTATLREACAAAR